MIDQGFETEPAWALYRGRKQDFGDKDRVEFMDMKATVTGQTFIFMGEECCNIRLDSGTILEEVPVTSIKMLRKYGG